MLNKTKNILSLSYKQGYQQALLKQQGGSYDAEITELDRFEGVNLIHSNNLMRIHSGLVAMAIPGMGMLVDDHFFELSEEAQRFTLFHELGHLFDPMFDTGTLSHKKFKERRKLAGKGLVLEEEQVADDYAVEQMGLAAGVAALGELQAIASRYRIRRDKELELRKERLQNLGGK